MTDIPTDILTDILARARCKSPYLVGSAAQQLIDELADEVERLTTESNILHGEADMQRADNERLRKSLAWYANFENWRGNGMQDALVFHDYGERARAALEPKP